jgi:integrase/recombinase XerD
LAGGQPQRRRTIKLKAPRKHPTILTVTQIQAVLDACTRLRDRFLFVLLWESGIRIGEALGLRHEDIAAAEGELTVTPRVNDNRARAKSASPRTIPVDPQVIRLYADYLHGEYGEPDSDYAFVNLWGQPFGRPFDLRRGLRPGTAASPGHRGRLRPTLVPSFLRHPAAAHRYPGRGG